jgi:hypothetical protein
VFVPGAARAAVAATGMWTVTEFEWIGVVVATGTARQIESARTQPGVTYLEANPPIEMAQETSNVATRGEEVEAAPTGTAHRFTDGAQYATVGARTTSFDKGTGMVDVVAAVARLTVG